MNATFSTSPFSVNGRRYEPPARPVVAICMDGCEDDYLTVALARGRMPHLARMADGGYRGLARAALPTYTNVNNACIVTGVPPSVTGISGNFFLDPGSGAEVMMNSARYLRCDTILAAAARSGRKVAMVTAKEKLRDLLTRGLQGIAFSAERAGEQIRDLPGLEGLAETVREGSPDIYSAEASLFVLRAGVALLESRQSDFLYLSLTDYVQHRHAPSAPEALDFYEAIDHQLGRLLELGATVGATADHGMNAKTGADGRPNVIYLESELREEFGGGVTVICPITDPYVVHHGALGSAVTIHLAEGVSETEVVRWLSRRQGVTEVSRRQESVTRLELPPDRIGDLMVFSDRDVVMGRTPRYHDLSRLRGGLRSHGGRFEETVPLLLSEPGRRAGAAGDPRNFDLFAYLCEGGSR